MCIGSCIGSMLGSCCCAMVGNSCKTDSKNSRMPYIITFILFSIVAFIITLVGPQELVDLPFYNITVCEEACARNGAIYRIGLCLTLFFATHFLILCIPGTGCFHTFLFPLKLMLLTVLVIWSFWWDSGPVQNFAHWARWFSFFFLIVQAFMLICWGWDTHDAMMARMTGDDGQEAEPNVKYAYVGLCLFIIFGCFILIGVFFGEYATAGCSNMQFLLSVTLIYLVFQLVASYMVVHGNGFVASVVMLYITYLIFQALATNIDFDCPNPDWTAEAPMYTGFFILMATLSFVGYETRMLNAEELSEVQSENADIESGDKSAAIAHNHPSMRKLNRFFHMTMTLGSFYITMIMTNWGSDRWDDRWYGPKANTWLIAVGQWFTMLLYMWVLFAPKIFPEREFGFN